MLNLSNIYKHRQTTKQGETMERAHHTHVELAETYFKSLIEAGELSLRSMEGVRLYVGALGDVVQDGVLVEHLAGSGAEVLRPRAGSVARRVVAIDTSSVKVAEGGGGLVVALRGALAVREAGRLSVEVVGPLIYFVRPENLGRIMGAMGGGGAYRLDETIQRVLASLFEKRLQEYAVERFDDSIMLFDGSLSAGPIDNPIPVMERILWKAGERGCDVVAFSKTSVLSLWGERIQSLMTRDEPPYLIHLTPLVRRLNLRVRLLGEIFLARLSRGGGGFRVDARLVGDVEEVFGSLLSSDPLIHGYPETLILAHDYATFTKPDIIAIQAALARRAEVLEGQSVRDLLFNPLDGDWR